MKGNTAFKRKKGRPPIGDVQDIDQADHFPHYRKSIIRALCKVMKKLEKYKGTQKEINKYLTKFNKMTKQDI